MIKVLITTILLIFSLVSTSQKSLTYNVKGGGTITFISKQSGQEIIFDIPSLKTKFHNFIFLPKDSTYPSSIVESFSCRDDKDQIWSFYSVVIGKDKSFIISNDGNTIQVEYASTPIGDRQMYYVFEKIKHKQVRL